MISIKATDLTQRTRLVRHSWSKGVSDGGRGAEENLNLGEGMGPVKAVRAASRRGAGNAVEKRKSYFIQICLDLPCVLCVSSEYRVERYERA